MSNKITLKQNQVLIYLISEARKNSIQPSIREMAHHFGYKSTNAIHAHLEALQKKKKIQLTNKARSIKILD